MERWKRSVLGVHRGGGKFHDKAIKPLGLAAAVLLSFSNCSAKLSVSTTGKACQPTSTDASCAASPAEIPSTNTSATTNTIATPPGSFAIVTPVANSLTWNVLPKILWTASAGALNYNVTIATDAACSNIIESASSIATNEYQVTMAMTAGTPYYLCVSATNLGSTVSASNTGYRTMVGLEGSQRFAPEPASYSRQSSFGGSVAVSEDGSTLVVGAQADPYDDKDQTYTSAAGSAYVYIQQGGQWVFQQKLVASGVNARVAGDFGSVVVISGDTIAIGTWKHTFDENGANSLTDAGAVFVFKRTSTTWSQEQKLVGTGVNGRSASDQFGRSIALSGDTLVVGASGQGYDESGANLLSGAGATFVFFRSGSTWSLQQKLVGSGTNGRISGDGFGYSVAISGDTLAVSAFRQDYDDAGANLVNNAGAVFVYTRTGVTWTLQQKLVATGTNARIANDNFGRSLAIDADTLAVGASAHGYDAAGANLVASSGAVFVFLRSSTTWSLQQKLVATGTNARVTNDSFGSAVSLYNQTLAVSSPNQGYDEAGANLYASSGAAFVFLRSGATWSQQQKLVEFGVSSRKGDQFSMPYNGSAIAVVGDVVIAGARNHRYDLNGNATVFENGAVFSYSRAGAVWSGSQKVISLIHNIPESQFGAAVALSSDNSTLVVGSPAHGFDADNSNYFQYSGAVYVYIWQNTQWQLQQKIVPTGLNAREFNGFGLSVGISGDTIIVGAPYNRWDENGDNGVTFAGAAFVYTRSSGVWTQQQKLVGVGTNGRLSGDSFGYTVAIDQDTVVVSAPFSSYDAAGNNFVNGTGAAFVFTRTGSTWSIQQKLVAMGTNARNITDQFGYSAVAISGNTIVIGSYGHGYDATGANLLAGAGAAFVYTRSGTTWTQQQKLVGFGTNGRQASAAFGYSVAIDGETILVGAYKDQYDASGNNLLANAGAAYVFTRTAGTWSGQQKLVATGTNSRNASDEFGKGLALRGDLAILTAPGHQFDTNGTNALTSAGGAWLFKHDGTTWNSSQKFSGFGSHGHVAGGNFGTAAAVSDSHVIIGSNLPYDPTGTTLNNFAGQVFTFKP